MHAYIFYKALVNTKKDHQENAIRLKDRPNSEIRIFGENTDLSFRRLVIQFRKMRITFKLRVFILLENS